MEVNLEPEKIPCHQFERLVAEVIRTQQLVSFDGEDESVSIWLGDWELTLYRNGKWHIG